MKIANTNVINTDEIYQPFYFAYYKKYNQPIAISNNLNLVKEYMEIHRHVKPRCYRIEELSYTPGEIMIDYADSIIENYEDWYIPSVDVEMIKLNQTDLCDLFSHTLNGMKQILLTIQDIKKIPDSDKKTILEAMQIMSGYTTKKKIWNKIIDSFKLSDLLYIDIDEYLYKRQLYIDMRETKTRWGFLIEKKGGDDIE